MRINLIKQFNLKSNLTCNIYTEACNMLLIYIQRHFLTWVTFHTLMPRGYTLDSSDRDDQRIFLGLKFSIYRDFSGRKILVSILQGSLILVGTLGGIQNNLKIRNSSRISQLRSSSGNFYGWGIWHGIFSGGGGYSLVQGFFCLKPLGFWVVSIFAPIQSSLSLEIRSTPLDWYDYMVLNKPSKQT